MSEEVNDQLENENLDQTSEELENIEENIAEDLPQNNNYYFDDSSPFKDQLTTFFTEYRPSKLKHVKALAKEYKGKEEEALDYLYYKYVTRVQAIVNKKRVPRYVPGQRIASKIGDSRPIEERKRLNVSGRKIADLNISSDDTLKVVSPKGGAKKWIMLIVLLLILAAAAYFLKDKFMGGHQEHDASNEKVEELLNSEEKISEESLEHAKTVEDSVALIEKMLDEGIAPDSTKASITLEDSTRVELEE